MNQTNKIFVAGHRGMVGSAIVRRLESEGYNNLLVRTRRELDLTNQEAVKAFFEKERPEYVFLAAAKVGGIWANKTEKADFIYNNLQVQNNVIHSAWKYGVRKLLFLGSSCIYPKLCPQPIKEEYLLSGPLEETNDAYAVAKIAGIKMCQSFNEQYGTNFISVMPTNLYGPNDNFDLEHSHVLPALIRKMHLGKYLRNRDFDAIKEDLRKYAGNENAAQLNNDEIIDILAKSGIKRSNSKRNTQNPTQVELWGTGSAKREFLHVDDLADAVVFLMKSYDSSEFINIGTGEDLTIKELAELTKSLVAYDGTITWDATKPDGIPRKLLDVTKLHNLGWKHKYSLQEGLRNTIDWFVENREIVRG